MNIWERYDPRSSNYMYTGYNDGINPLFTAGNKERQDYLYNQSLRSSGSNFGKQITNDWQKKGFFQNYWDSFEKSLYEDPMKAVGGIGSIWNMYQDFRNNKDKLSLLRDDYNTQKYYMEQNNQRAQEAFDMQKANRAGHQL